QRGRALAEWAAAASLVTPGASLVSTYNGTLLLAQTLMPCMNAILLGTLMYRSRLVPRAIPLMGLIGAPLLITSTIAAFFGVIPQLSAWSAIATLPVALWELSLGLWLTLKGFRPSPITAGMTAVGAPPAPPPARPPPPDRPTPRPGRSKGPGRRACRPTSSQGRRPMGGPARAA